MVSPSTTLMHVARQYSPPIAWKGRPSKNPKSMTIVSAAIRGMIGTFIVWLKVGEGEDPANDKSPGRGVLRGSIAVTIATSFGAV